MSHRSDSILGLMMMTDTEKVSQSGVISIGLSDHMLVFCDRKVVKPTFYNRKDQLNSTIGKILFRH